jgi:hypothetical protein
MKTPPKRSLKIQNKYDRLSRLNTGCSMQLHEKISLWRHVINLHEEENNTKFSVRTTSKAVFLWRNK